MPAGEQGGKSQIDRIIFIDNDAVDRRSCSRQIIA